MMFHRKPSLPSDSELFCFTSDGETEQKFIDNMLDVYDGMKEITTKNISIKDTTQK